MHYKEIISQKLKLKYSLNRDSYIKVIDSIIENNVTFQLDINSYSTQNSEISKKPKHIAKGFHDLNLVTKDKIISSSKCVKYFWVKFHI